MPLANTTEMGTKELPPRPISFPAWQNSLLYAASGRFSSTKFGRIEKNDYLRAKFVQEIMINRLLIRIKTVQLVYAYMQGSLNQMNSDEEMAQSIEASYKLYNYLLALVVKLTDYRRQQIENARKKFIPTREERFPNVRFVNSEIAKCIVEKSGVMEYVAEHELMSDFDTELYRNLLEQIEKLPAYQEFMTQRETPTLEQEKELWKNIFAEVITRNDMLDATLEERCLYWNDDLTTVTQFVVRSIKQMDPSAETIKLAQMFERNEDQTFARDLFHITMEHAHEYLQLVDQQAWNWHIDRMPMMDKVIMVCALAEIRNFPDIALNISMNEYIELAKIYCAPDSPRFVTGIVDKIVKGWKEEGLIFK